MKDILLEKGAKKVAIADLARDDMAECVEDAFRYSHLVLASPTYDGDVFPYMSTFMHHLKSKNFQNKTVGFIENGTWAPMAASIMMKEMASLKNMKLIEEKVTIKSALKKQDINALEKLAEALL